MSNYSPASFAELEKAFAKVPIMVSDDMKEMLVRGCQVPGCQHDHGNTPLYLNSRCHTHAGTEVAACNGQLFVSCAVCHKPIARFAVR